jgi:voltage-gated potassium channel
MRTRVYQIIFGTDTKAGRLFDVVLLWLILISVGVVIIESIPEIGHAFPEIFHTIEWVFTVLFSIEYLLRLWSSPKPLRYMKSGWGFIDLFSIMPTYLSLVFPGYHYLLVVRIFRLLRVFRILKLVRFSQESLVLIKAMRASSYKISVFLFTVLTTITLLGTLMYVVEGSENGYTSIPQSIYWAIVTVTTVGYGDVVPVTVVGKILSSISMIIGYAIIAVPTGIITVELSKSSKEQILCPTCGSQNTKSHNYCSNCGSKMEA